MFPRQYAYFLLTNPLKAIKDHEENTALTLWSHEKLRSVNDTAESVRLF